MFLAPPAWAFEYRFARFFVSFGRFSPPSQCWRLRLLMMSLTSSVVAVVIRKVPIVELLGFETGVAYWRFPTYVRTKRDLHVLRALGTRSFILRFQRFFSGDANPSFQSWLIFSFLFRVILVIKHRFLVVERVDVDAVRRLCFHFCELCVVVVVSRFYNNSVLIPRRALITPTLRKRMRRFSYSFILLAAEGERSFVGSFVFLSEVIL